MQDIIVEAPIFSRVSSLSSGRTLSLLKSICTLAIFSAGVIFFFSPTPKAAMSFCGVSENLRTASRVFCSVGFIGKLAVPTTPDTYTHASAQMFADAVEKLW